LVSAFLDGEYKYFLVIVFFIFVILVITVIVAVSVGHRFLLHMLFSTADLWHCLIVCCSLL